MFTLKEKYEVDRRLLKCDYIRYSPAETSLINTLKTQIYINITREDSVISFLNSCLHSHFEIIKKVDNSRYGNGNDIKLIHLTLIALFSTFKMTTSSRKHLKKISLVRILFLYCII